MRESLEQSPLFRSGFKRVQSNFLKQIFFSLYYLGSCLTGERDALDHVASSYGNFTPNKTDAGVKRPDDLKKQ